MTRLSAEPIAPSAHEARLAAQARHSLANGHLDVSELPERVLRMISLILEETAKGRSITVVPFDMDMTTTEAAEYLNVSRPFLVRLLEDGTLPFHYVGAHRRVAFEDLRSYKETRRERSYAALAELQEQAQKLNMGY